MTKNFDPKDPSEILTLGFDLTDLVAGDAITAAVFGMSVISGNDPAAEAMVFGLPQITGAIVTTRIIGGVDGVRYRLKVTADLASGRRVTASRPLQCAAR